MTTSSGDPAPSVFGHVLHTEAELRKVIAEPGALTMSREIDRFDAHCREIIGRCPFVLMATADKDGRCDVSPRGGDPGFVRVVDDTRLLLPEMAGNRRADTMRNILETGQAGLMFLVPGWGEILRANGRAWIVNDREVLAPCAFRGTVPQLGIGIEIEVAYIHCAKASLRSGIWQPAKWPSLEGMPSLAAILHDHSKGSAGDIGQLTEQIRESYATRTFLAS
jgi:PPOX class probable FMN-dependent enzyme